MLSCRELDEQMNITLNVCFAAGYPRLAQRWKTNLDHVSSHNQEFALAYNPCFLCLYGLIRSVVMC